MTLLAGASGNASWLRQGRSLQVVSYVPSSPQARQRGREGTQGLTAFPVGSRAACVQSTSQIGKENKTFTFVQSSPPANQVSCSTFVLRWLKEKPASYSRTLWGALLLLPNHRLGLHREGGRPCRAHAGCGRGCPGTKSASAGQSSTPPRPRYLCRWWGIPHCQTPQKEG